MLYKVGFELDYDSEVVHLLKHTVLGGQTLGSSNVSLLNITVKILANDSAVKAQGHLRLHISKRERGTNFVTCVNKK
jgi:hypothetical protein